MRLFIASFAAVLCIALSLAAFAGRYKDLELFSQVLNLAETYYFRPVPFRRLVHGAIKGMLRELDGHSHFFLPEELAAFKRHVQNKAFILGIEADKDRETGAFLILSVVKRSPAARAGLKAGDKILKIDGKRTDLLTLTDWNRLLQTKSQKNFLVVRPPSAAPFKIKIRPGPVRLDPAVRFDYEGYSYLRIYQFSASSFYKISKMLRNPLPEKGLILDLRGNPGGFFDQSVKTADLFLKEGVIAHYKGRGETKKSFRAKEANALPQSFPLVVLTDERSASGSEIITGALKDHSRALIVGRKTFGKGSVQSFFKAGEDYGLKLTVGEYTTPKGDPIHQKGISPHIELPKTAKPKSAKKPLQDEEVQTALNILRNFPLYSDTYLSKPTP